MTDTPATAQTTTILGHTFRPMNDNDRSYLAGATDTALICDDVGDNETLLLWDPVTKELSEIKCNTDGEPTERRWTFTRIL